MPRRHTYRSVVAGVEQLPNGIDLPRHRHTAGYATVVLGGAFVEASFAGRFVVAPGDVLLHGNYDCHANQALTRRGPQLLRLPWFDDDLEGHFRVADPDRLARIAEHDPLAATAELRRVLEPAAPSALHWMERLAVALTGDPSLCLSTWAERERLAPETLSRGFREVFGVSPKLFRLEVRTRRAWRALLRSDRSLTAIAHEQGFADLAHMSRSVCEFTGFPPSQWRAAADRTPALRSTPFKLTTARGRMLVAAAHETGTQIR
jgi:AraC-like DNA-binding protein